MRGVSFIEIIIYVAVIGLVLTTFVSFGINVSNSRAKTYVIAEVQANMRAALVVMSQKIRAANGINIGASIFDTDPGKLVLIMAGSAVNPTIFDLTQDNGMLRMTEGFDPAINVTNEKIKVTNLKFANLSGSGVRENIKINITLEYANDNSDVNYSYSQDIQTAISLRQ